MGISVAGLSASIITGDTARRRVSGRHYPRNYPGIAMWAETLAELRRQLIKIRIGWKIGYTGNYETVYSEDFGIAIAVVGGDKYTGRLGSRHPKLTRRRGPMTTRRVNRNRILGQMELGLDIPTIEGIAPDEACRTWFLVIHPGEESVWVELSLPQFIGDDGLVEEWVERILVPAIPVSGAVAPISDIDDEDEDGNDLVTRPE
jgi:hypothetical protein